MAKILLFALVGGLSCLVGGLVGEGVIAGWPALQAALAPPAWIGDFAKVGLWTVALAVPLALGLVVGQNLYLRRRPVAVGQFLAVTAGAVVAGLAAGVAGQGMQSVLVRAAGSLSGAARVELAQGMGWMLLGGLLAACIAVFVPNLPRGRAALAGALGGALGAWAFFDIGGWVGDAPGRVAGAVALGACVGSMLAVAERAFRKAWLEVVYGPRESRVVSLGGEPVTVGSDARATIYARGAPGLAYRFRFKDADVLCEDVPAGRTTTLAEGDSRRVGNLVIHVRGMAGGRPADAAAGAGVRLVMPGRKPVNLRVGTTLAADDVPGLVPRTARSPVAEVVRNPKRPDVIGLRNLSTRTWRHLGSAGTAAEVPPGKPVEIRPGSRLDFGAVTASIDAPATGRAGAGVVSRPLVRAALAAVAAGGLLALGTADFRRRHPAGPRVNSLPINVLSMRQAGEQRPLRLGVLPSRNSFDDVKVILRELGSGYRYEELGWEAITTPGADLDAFDVVFLPCPGLPAAEPEADGTAATGRIGREEIGRAKTTLRDYVSGGGTLYASCLATRDLREMFPEVVSDQVRTHWLTRTPLQQQVDAAIEDASMREQLGPTLALSFDQSGWIPAQLEGDRVDVLVTGDFEWEWNRTALAEVRKALNEPPPDPAREPLSGRTTEARAPLVAKARSGDGTLVVTAFHNGKQRSGDEIALLKHLVCTTVTARLEARTREELVEAGFTAARHDLVTRSPGSPERRGTYSCARPGPLRFAVGFNGTGVRLRIDLVGPDGRAASHVTTEPVVVEVPDAAAGAWTYVVTAEQLPSDNFPFTITIAEK